jgi:hypothetical protein
MIDRQRLIESNPLAEYLANRVQLRKSGKTFVTNECPKVTHRQGHNCVTVDPALNCWCCHDCEEGGSIIDWIMLATGRGIGEVMRELEKRTLPVRSVKPEIVATYDYTDETGKLLFQCVRFEPKDFRQRQPDSGGSWRWNLDGITRVLFRLPQVLAAQTVVVVEGEKDCLALEELGLTATTNCGGSKGWLSAYADSLKGKDLVLIPDQDEPGLKHLRAVLESVSEIAGSVKTVSLPRPYKDVSDYLASFPSQEKAKTELTQLIDSTQFTVPPPPFYSICEMEEAYRKFIQEMPLHSFDLGRFLPSLGKLNRRLTPGELVLIIASTGVGKSCICQAIARAASPLSTLLFELELPLELVFERFVQMELGCRGSDVERDYGSGTEPLWQTFGGLKHILVCPESGLSTSQIEAYIKKSQLRFGRTPGLVIVDYIGLVRDPGRSRYEQVSAAAEQLKVIAKRTKTIIVMASQISRPPRREETKPLEVHLYDAKESGSLENSAGLVIGCWRPQKDRLVLKVLKNTKGMSGTVINASFNGALMRITEIDNESVPSD